MTVELFWDIAAKVGLPFALLAVALVANRAGIWVWGRELEDERTQFAARLAELESQIAQERIQWRQDRDYYRDRAYAALIRAEQLDRLATDATGLAERQIGRRSP